MGQAQEYASSIKRLRIERICLILLTIAVGAQHRAEAQVLRHSLRMPGVGHDYYDLKPDGEGGLFGLGVSSTGVCDSVDDSCYSFEPPIFLHVSAHGEFIILKEWELEFNAIDRTYLKATDSNFYGILREGGAFGYGVLWRITANGEYREIHDFNPEEEGGFRYTPLIEGSDGRIYTATRASGPGNAGTILAFDPNGGAKVVHVVEEEHSRGVFEFIRGPNGKFYGTTDSSFARGEDGLSFLTKGSLFQISESGLFEEIHVFEGGVESSQIAVGKDEILYGRILDHNDDLYTTGLFSYSDSHGFGIIKSFDQEDLVSVSLRLWPISSGEIWGSFPRRTWDKNGVTFKLNLQDGYQQLNDDLYLQEFWESSSGIFYGIEIPETTILLFSDWRQAIVRIAEDGSKEEIIKVFKDGKYITKFIYGSFTEISINHFAIARRRKSDVFIDLFEIIEGPLSSSQDLGGGWRLVEWFGVFLINHYPWILHGEHGWFYDQVSEDSNWFFDPILGWLWTSPEIYPFIYSVEGTTWLYYQTSTTSPRLFFDFSNEEWIEVL